MTIEQRLRRIEEKISQKKTTKNIILKEDYNVDNINKRLRIKILSSYRDELISLLSLKMKQASKEFGENTPDYNLFEEGLRGETMRVFNRLIQDYIGNKLI